MHSTVIHSGFSIGNSTWKIYNNSGMCEPTLTGCSDMVGFPADFKCAANPHRITIQNMSELNSPSICNFFTSKANLFYCRNATGFHCRFPSSINVQGIILQGIHSTHVTNEYYTVKTATDLPQDLLQNNPATS